VEVDTTYVRFGVLFDLGALVYLVCEDLFREGESDSVVEPGQQLGECLVLAADEHRDGSVLVCRSGYTADRVDDTNGDFTVLDELSEVGQEIRDLIFIPGLFRTLL